MKVLQLVWIVIGVICGGGTGLAAERMGPDESEALFVDGAVTRLEVELSEQALADLKLHPRQYVKGTVREVLGEPPKGGTPNVVRVYTNVGVHLKGNYGTFQHTEGKPSLTLNFDKFVRKQKFHGLTKIHLNNSGQDPTFLNEIIGRKLMHEANVPVGRASHALLKLNGRDVGLYVMVEGYDKTFLKRYWKDASGNLYDSEFMHDITDSLKRASGSDTNDHKDLHALFAAASEPDLEARMRKLETVLNVDRFISFLAVEMMARHFDGYAMSKNNYWIYHDPASGKMTFIPHGMDQVFYAPRASLFPPLEGELAQALMETRTGKAGFRAVCNTLLTNSMLGFTNWIRSRQQALAPIMAIQVTNVMQRWSIGVSDLNARIPERVQHIREFLIENPPLLISLKPGQQIQLTNWIANRDAGECTFQREKAPGGEIILKCDAPLAGGSGSGSWQCTLLLGKGRYAVFARARTERDVFLGPTSPIAIKIANLARTHSETQRISPNELELLLLFANGRDASDEFLLDATLTAVREAGTYRLGPILISQVE